VEAVFFLSVIFLFCFSYFFKLILSRYRQAMPLQTEKNILEVVFSSVLSQ